MALSNINKVKLMLTDDSKINEQLYKLWFYSFVPSKPVVQSPQNNTGFYYTLCLETRQNS